MNGETMVVANPDNCVVFDKQAISVLARVKSELVFIIGTDNDNTGKAFEGLISGARTMINYRGLNITDRDCIIAIANFTDSPALERKVYDIVKEESCCMPSSFDFKSRSATRIHGEKHLRFTDASPMKYFKFHASLIGNPKYLLVFKMSKSRYQSSNFYINVVKTPQSN